MERAEFSLLFGGLKQNVFPLSCKRRELGSNKAKALAF